MQALLPEVKLLPDLHRTQIGISIGAYGICYYNDTVAHSPSNPQFGNYYACIQATETAVIAVEGNTADGNFSAITLPAGMAIYGFFKRLTLASGAVVAYLGKNNA